MLFHGRHLILLFLAIAALAAAVAIADAVGIASPGIVGAFGLYGGLYAALIAVTSRAAVRAARALGFIALGSVLCMLNVAASRDLGPAVVAWLGSAGPAALLVAASASGAVCFAGAVRWCLRLPLPGWAVAPLGAGCAVGSWIVLRSGLYHSAPGAWFTASWWVSFSAGLCVTDALRWLGKGARPRSGAIP